MMLFLGLILQICSAASLSPEAVTLIASAPPEVVAAVDGWRPAPTRSGTLRLYGSPDADPELVTALIAQRLLNGKDAVEVQGALIDFLAQTPDYAQLALQLWQERPELRIYLVTAFQDAPERMALLGLAAAFQDKDHRVRAEAGRIAGYRRDLPLTPWLMDALDDPVAEVRAISARTLGWRGDVVAFDFMVPMLSDETPEVRLNVLRALQLLSPEKAKHLSHAIALQADEDSRVARAAAQIIAD